MRLAFTSPKARTAAWAVAAFAAGLVIFAVIWYLASIRTTQLEGTPVGKKLLASSERVLDCTEPDGECFKESQQRTADAVGDINRVIVLAAACSVGLDPEWSVQRRQAAIQSCVIHRLARKP